MVVLQERVKFGKSNSDRIRKEGLVLGTVNNGNNILHVSLDAKFVAKNVVSPFFLNTVIHAEYSGKKILIIPTDVAFHAVTNTALHIDFIKVEKNKEVSVLVPVQIEGSQKCVGLKLGGKLNLIKYSVKLTCKVENIPQKITIDISNFNIGKTFKLSDVKMPNGVTFKEDCAIFSIIGRNRKDSEEAAAAITEGQTNQSTKA